MTLTRERVKGWALAEISGRYQRTLRRQKYLKCLTGKSGLEIGGPSAYFDYPFLPVYPAIQSLDGCNFSSQTRWEGKIRPGKNYKYGQNRRRGHQYICESADLHSIASEAYDFVASCHSLEHVANPLKALAEWIRVLKEEGILLLVLPDKRGTFDHRRPVTPFNHLLQDFERSVGEDDLTHLNEILKLHDLSRNPWAGSFEDFKARALNNFRNRCLHHHVFDKKLIKKTLLHLRLEILALDSDPPSNLIAMARKGKRNGRPI